MRGELPPTPPSERPTAWERPEAVPGRSGDNSLCAVLALVKAGPWFEALGALEKLRQELDRQGLEIVRRAVDQRME